MNKKTNVGFQTIDIEKTANAIINKKIIAYDDIPVEIQNHPAIVKAARKTGLRKISACGFDVLKNNFFVNEIVYEKSDYESVTIPKTKITRINTFEEYYEYLGGEIYDNACYYGYSFSSDLVKKYHINEKALNIDSLVQEDIDHCLPDALVREAERAKEVRKNKSNIKKWIEKYNSCETIDQLLAINDNHRKSKDEIDEVFYFWNYINTYGQSKIDTIMAFINTGVYPSIGVQNALPFVFDLDEVEKRYGYIGGAPSTNARYNKRYRTLLDQIKSGKYEEKVHKYFDANKSYYCIKTEYTFEGDLSKQFDASKYVYFEDFDSFAKYLDNDLSDCNLRDARNITIDDTYKINDNTLLPVNDINTLTKKVIKKYDKYTDSFLVEIKWINQFDQTVYKKERSFRYFFDFLAFLKNDLSYADLLFCDDLINLQNHSEINFDNARLTSRIMESFQIPYQPFGLVEAMPEIFDVVLKNEIETQLALKNENADMEELNPDISEDKVYYISDIHLLHTLQRKNARSIFDYFYIIQNLIDDMLGEFDSFHIDGRGPILIGGDVSSDFRIFELFIKIFKNTLIERKLDVSIIFILGNHELWNQEDKSIDEIVQMYRSLLDEHGMYLLHNEIIYFNNQNIQYIKKEELCSLGTEEIRNRVRYARFILFGGLGYARYNKTFNANQGIYRSTINRRLEIELSAEFESLYDKVAEILSDRKVIIFTHMIIDEWKKNPEYKDNFIYVCGHSHINTYFDDGLKRLYADNQIGYYNDRAKLKYFLVDSTYDLFMDYEDGIYEISRDEYQSFYRGKNLQMTFNRTVNKLYMLKKQGYYCFLHKNKAGKVSILNGGAFKALDSNNIDYYYQNMGLVIQYIMKPLSEYQDLQKKLSDYIRKIGGNGKIHGAIIDIDGGKDQNGWNSIAYSHLYVNPFDSSITPYYALNMVVKYIYPSFPTLLQDKCPALFDNYERLLSTTETDTAIIKPVDKAVLSAEPILYLDTDMYKPSRELRKMQRLNYNILSTWYDNIPNMTLPQEKIEIEDRTNTIIGQERLMKCGMIAKVIEYRKNRDITVRFEDGSIVRHTSILAFEKGQIWNRTDKNDEKMKKSKKTIPQKQTYLGRTEMMNCGMKATVIEDFGCNNITVQFEDGLIRRNKRRDKFREGKIAHRED